MSVFAAMTAPSISSTKANRSRRLPRCVSSGRSVKVSACTNVVPGVAFDLDLHTSAGLEVDLQVEGERIPADRVEGDLVGVEVLEVEVVVERDDVELEIVQPRREDRRVEVVLRTCARVRVDRDR